VLHLVLFGAGSAFFVGDALPAPPPTPEESLEQVLFVGVSSWMLGRTFSTPTR